MDKRYQVFVSSTYDDLQKERQEVMHALLELDCMPSGMELFPAANEDQWTLIKKVIDDCDYYIVIVAGRYGSVDDKNTSYTEKEYKYALEKEKPIIAFLHKDPSSIPSKHTEKKPELAKKLETFRKLCQKKMCKFWESPAELGSAVSRSLIRLIKSHAAIGWVRGDLVPDQEATVEILGLRKKIEELENTLLNVSSKPPEDTEDLCQGNDEFVIEYSYSDSTSFLTKSARLKTTWNQLFSIVAPHLINEAGERTIRLALNDFCKDIANRNRDFLRSRDIKTSDSDFQTIKIQLRALGLITKSEKPRSIKDTATYWKLTPYGDTLLTKLRAIRKKTDEITN